MRLTQREAPKHWMRGPCATQLVSHQERIITQSHSVTASFSVYVNRKGEVKWSPHEIEVPTVKQCVKEDALEV